VSAYLADQRERGRVDTDADTEAAAIMLMGACYLRVFNRHMLGSKGGRLPSREQTVQGLAQLLAPRA
jgi:hypothetical protein